MSDCVGVLSLLFVYPVKSCAGIALESARIAETGLAHDRALGRLKPGRLVRPVVCAECEFDFFWC